MKAEMEKQLLRKLRKSDLVVHHNDGTIEFFIDGLSDDMMFFLRVQLHNWRKEAKNYNVRSIEN